MRMHFPDSSLCLDMVDRCGRGGLNEPDLQAKIKDAHVLVSGLGAVSVRFVGGSHSFRSVWRSQRILRYLA